MTILDKIENSGKEMWEVLKENWCKIIMKTFILFLVCPIIRWGVLSVIYIIKKTEFTLNKLIQQTFANNLDWYIGFLINVKRSLSFFIFLFLFVWVIYTLNKDEVGDTQKGTCD